jgi:3-methylcrotonyl-CoA carboxylase alpha subunit
MHDLGGDPMFHKILIANRGEIACRIAATARRMGIRTVAVYSAADAGAKHVAACDEAVLIGPAAASESYLLGEKIIAVALATGAQAIHPGYGFLSEHAGFAQACADAGLVFIGPPAAAIRAMGSKSAAKTLMATANVPLVPGYHGSDQTPALLRSEAARIGYPVLLKASAGGGGKGMRIVDTDAGFEAALASCQREARNSFGDDKILVEKYLTRSRHIEIQVFADHHGNCLHLSERDCSVQRRHQKVLEEAPAPGLNPQQRHAMGSAAVAAARAVGYVGAGTVEFIASQDGTFYFMEMNTRLQVEHPVTEMITQLDLVEWQLRVAAGETLPLQQDQLHLTGHAIEARIYAENPENGFLPSIGTLHYLHTPDAVEFEVQAQAGTSAPVRIDSGVRAGDAITPFYDPMIAKLIVWGHDRDAALANMRRALAQYRIVGLATNIGFLQRLIAARPFATADLDTGLIERHHADLFPAPSAVPIAVLALAVATLLAQEATASHSSDPWAQTSGWRMNSVLSRQLRFADGTGWRELSVEYHGQDHWRLQEDGQEQQQDLYLRTCHGSALSISLGGTLVHGDVIRLGDDFHVFHAGVQHVLGWNDPLRHAGHREGEDGNLSAPMPGRIVAVLAETGQRVAKGTPLLIMEAMKMEHTITAPSDGEIEAWLYQVGEQVSEGAQLLTFKPA